TDKVRDDDQVAVGVDPGVVVGVVGGRISHDGGRFPVARRHRGTRKTHPQNEYAPAGPRSTLCHPLAPSHRITKTASVPSYALPPHEKRCPWAARCTPAPDDRPDGNVTYVDGVIVPVS